MLKNIEEYVRWPKVPLLLWSECNRIPRLGGRLRYHRYPASIKVQAKKLGVYLNSRGNGPAIAAFEFAGGVRPERTGNKNKWHIHHIYSGKFPYVGAESTTHSVKNRIHFSQSAGLCSLHPILDSICDEYASFAWYLWYESYKRFGYDPDGVFCREIDEYGFDKGKKVTVNVVCNQAE